MHMVDDAGAPVVMELTYKSAGSDFAWLVKFVGAGVSGTLIGMAESEGSIDRQVRAAVLKRLRTRNWTGGAPIDGS
jgi:hypothetical protein